MSRSMAMGHMRAAGHPSRALVGLVVVGGAALALRGLIKHHRSAKTCGKAVVLGLGYCGGAIARQLAAELGLEVIGTTRGEAGAAHAAGGVRTLVFGGSPSASEELQRAIREACVIIATAPPGEAGDPFLADDGLRAALEHAGQVGTLLIYLSSVGVYGDQQGRDVTEDTPAAPRTARAKRRLAAEEAWRDLSPHRLAIVRLPGIYGPFRGPVAKASEGNARIVKEGHVFSRIHVDDVANVCTVLAKCALEQEGRDLFGAAVINCCDSDPAPQHEVAALAYELLGRPVPPAVPFESAELSAMQRSFYEESRRMVNSKLLELVGQLKYPSYRSGLPASLAAERRLRPPSWSSRCVAAALGLAAAGGRTLAAPFLGQTQVRVALVDNGSLKPEATLSLRRLASSVEVALCSSGFACTVEAVSARFADRIPARELGGVAAEVLPGWLRRVSDSSSFRRQRVLLLPLLIGPSATLTKSMPDAARAMPTLDVEICPSLVCLCPVLCSSASATGAEELAQILADRLRSLPRGDDAADRVLLCDHGSPVARVAAAREVVREALAVLLNGPVQGCCMERREGAGFDFNGPLLEDALLASPTGAHVRVALLFLQEGKHAGPGGDITQIVASVSAKRPDLSIRTTQVLAGHERLVRLLVERASQSVPLRLFH